MNPAPEPVNCLGTALVVEDHDLVRSVLVQMLQQLGYRVLECRDGASALELLREQFEIGVVVTDVVLPGKTDGTAVLDWTREHRPSVKAVLISGYTEREMEARGAQTKGHEILAKPFRMSDLTQALLEKPRTQRSSA